MYTYRAKIVNVVDGDTVDADVDLGFDIWLKQRFRLIGVDTPEVRTKDPDEKLAGMRAKKRVEELCLNKDVVIMTTKDKSGKYGRILATILIPEDNVNVNQLLLREGLAKPYMLSKAFTMGKYGKE